MPSRNHTVRCPDPTWDDAGEVLKRRGTTRNAYLTRALENLLEEESWQARYLAEKARAEAAEAELKRIKGEQ